MERSANKYVTVAYDLFTKDEEGRTELVEKAPKEHPFQFITGMGVTLDAFEKNIIGLNEGDTFDFTIGVDDAYGPYEYEEEHVVQLDKEIFTINGHFDKNTIYPGNVVPLVNEDGNRFEGLVLEVTDRKVKIDLNDPLAGKELHFKGQVITSRPATKAEENEILTMMSGEQGCGGNCDGCGGSCGSHN